MENAYSILNTFHTAFALTQHLISLCPSESRRDYAEDQIAAEEALLDSGTLGSVELSRSLGSLAALQAWIAEDDRIGAELEAMYADYCDAQQELLAVC